MAEGNSMTAREAASNVIALEHSDVLRESVAVMVKEIMEAEIVRHEALSDRARCETSPPGCRSSLVKLGEVQAWSCG
jgi:hypothetical protein